MWGLWVRQFSRRSTSHYEALGISPKATQAEIKAAYYKLSLVYHPDRAGPSSSDKFQAITAAYEVLGNHKTRRIYDEVGMDESGSTGQYHQTQYHSSRKAEASRPPAPTGRTTIYDFDAWSRAHYAETFTRRATAKAKFDGKVNEGLKARSSVQHEQFVLGLLVMVFMFGLYGWTFRSGAYDRPKKT